MLEKKKEFSCSYFIYKMNDDLNEILILSSLSPLCMAIISLLIYNNNKYIIFLYNKYDVFCNILAAGILLSTIIVDIMPLLILKNNDNYNNYLLKLCILIGFLIGIFINKIFYYINNTIMYSIYRRNVYTSYDEINNANKDNDDVDDDDENFNYLYINNTFNSNNHKNKIFRSVNKINDIIKNMNSIIINSKNKNNIQIVADILDKQIHKLQYNVDRTRRLLLGSEYQSNDVKEDIDNNNNINNNDAFNTEITELKKIINILLLRLNNDMYDIKLLKELYKQINNLDKTIFLFHNNVENFILKNPSNKFYNIINSIIVYEEHTLPLNLMIAVLFDCVIDGVVIGSIFSLSNIQTDIYIVISNIFEMSILMITYTNKIKHVNINNIYIIILLLLPSIVLFLSILTTYNIGTNIKSTNYYLFNIILSFANCILIKLIITELLPEKEIFHDNLYLCIFFLGIYIPFL